MKKLCISFFIAIFLSSCSELTNFDVEKRQGTNVRSGSMGTKLASEVSGVQSASDVWVGAYLASYNHYVEPTGDWGFLRTEDIDWSAFTHLFYFSLHAEADGTLAPIKAYRNMSPDRINSVVTAAHKADKPVLYSVGGWGNYNGFSNAIKSSNRSRFVSSIISIMKKWGFDGVDIDMEPIKSKDTENYIAFINQLSSALQSVNVPMASEPLLSVATKSHPKMYGKIHDKIDQFNLMTYDLSNAWPEWVSWHNAAVYNGGLNFPSTGDPLPSTNSTVQEFIDAGVPASKLSIGIDFYGYVWGGGSGTSTGGITKPFQDWDVPPTVIDNVPYHKIMEEYYQSGEYHWDDKAKAAYLSIDKAGSANDKFISYDDERSIRAKFNYARQKGLGGTFIWELSGGYHKDKPSGSRDILLQAVKEAMNNGTSSGPTGDTISPNVSFSSPADGATISGSTTINVKASDNIGVTRVELFIDGNSVQNFTSSPYSYTWEVQNHEAHNTCNIEARATDAAGNTTSTSISISTSSSPGSSESPETATVYGESLTNDWHNASWKADVDFNNTTQSNSGSKSIKVDQRRWGALSLRSGQWGRPGNIEPGQYEAVELAVYAPNQKAEVSLMLENSQDQEFPKVSYGTIPTNNWVTVRIPMSKLNPDGQTVHRIDLLETSGNSITYFVDDVKLIGSGSSGTNSGTGGSYVDIYTDELAKHWINSSWDASIDFKHTANVANGKHSVKVVQDTWGGFSLHSGQWSNSVEINSSGYKSLEFKAYTTHPGVSFKVSLKSANGALPAYRSGGINKDEWITVSIPMNKLNPNNAPIQKINIIETSGSEKVYFIDDLRFVK